MRMNTSETSKNLQEKLRECAHQVGGGNELARKTGIPRRTLENYLNGKTEPVPSRLIAIAEAAGADLLWLMVGSGGFKAAQPGASDGAKPDGDEGRLERMRRISAALRQAVGQENSQIDRQLWTDLQGLAYIHGLPPESIPSIVGLIVRAYKGGLSQAAGEDLSTGTRSG